MLITKKIPPKIFSTLILLLSFYLVAHGQFKKDINPGTKKIEFNGTIEPLPITHAIHKFSQSFIPVKKLILLNQKETGLRLQNAQLKNNSYWVTGQSRKVKTRKHDNWTDQAKSYLEDVQTLISAPEEAYSFAIQSINSDQLGQTHIKVQQHYRGIPIFGAEAYLHGEETIESLNGQIHNHRIRIDPQPKVSPVDVKKIVIEDVPNYRPLKNDPFALFNYDEYQEELVIYFHEQGYRLAYHINIHNNLIDRWEYFVDAKSGEVLSKHQSICQFHNHDLPDKSVSNKLIDGPATTTANDLFNKPYTINTYNVDNGFYLIDASREMHQSTLSNMPNEPVGVIWTIDAFDSSPENDNFEYGHVFSTDNRWTNQKTGVSAHINAGIAYEYFKSIHQRESINGSGGNIISLINITDADGESLENAFWNGAAMFYGNGGDAFLPLARGLDVAAHELAHGVIQNTANLTYQGESGAMNESFADIFGTMVDRDDWLIGEDVVRATAFPSGALRNLQNPHNGAPHGAYGNGFQPKHITEKYNGAEDNGGVHINSGIPNHAYYLFATAVGKDKAERIFYRALNTYLLKSSQFIDLRLAVIQSANDLDANNDGVEAMAAAQAFDQVGIIGDEGGNYQQDVEENQGNQFLLATSADRQQLILYNSNFAPLATLYDKGIISRPSITDDGQAVVFIGSDKNIHRIIFDWENGTYDEGIIEESGFWRNVIVSKDGSKLAGTFDEQSPEIWVYDYGTQTSNNFTLFNPTFTEGIITGDVKYADAMEFDFTGEHIMYDALSSIPSTNGDPIEYWDIGFLRVWNNAENIWSLGTIEKLFTTLPEGISVGNPTFSKNSPYIITFDLVENDEDFSLIAANIETGELNNLLTNVVPNYPNYNITDKQISFDISTVSYDLASIFLDDSKINLTSQETPILLEESRWGIWFANGIRNLNTSTSDLQRLPLFVLYPNPVQNQLAVTFELDQPSEGVIEIFGMDGKKMSGRIVEAMNGVNQVQLDVSNFPTGTYLMRTIMGNYLGSKLFIKK